MERNRVPTAGGNHSRLRDEDGGHVGKRCSRFAAFEPPHRLALVQISPPSPFRFELQRNLTPNDAGCEFEDRLVVNSPPGVGWLGRLLLRSTTSHLDGEIPALATRCR